MKVQVEVDDFVAKEIQEEIKEVTGKRFSLRKVAKAFAQDLIDRYFSVEYLDAEELEYTLEEE